MNFSYGCLQECLHFIFVSSAPARSHRLLPKMPADVSSQVDIGSLSLSGLGQFSTLLTALSADDVQPLSLLQLQKLGEVFRISGPVAAKTPEYLQRYQSTRVERLGILVGWRKGDSASIMAQSTGGQAIALLALCLCSLYQSSGAGNIFFTMSHHILPYVAGTSSPRDLQKVAGVLANKLGLVGFGTILAKQVCRIHDAYILLQQEVPGNLLENISEDWMAELLVNISKALEERNGVIRIRGCYGMGYILALAVTVFPDDSLVTIEDLVIHEGNRSSSIRIEILSSLGPNPLEIQLMERIHSMESIFCSTSHASGTFQSSKMRPLIHGDFAWKGLVSALLHLELQQFGVVCTHEIVQAVGVCVLAGASGPQLTDCHLAAIQILGDNHRAIIHQRCEEAMGVLLPRTYVGSTFHDALEQLEEAIKPVLEANPSNGFGNFGSKLFAEGKESPLSKLLCDKIWLAWCMLFVNAHENATWRPGDWGSELLPSPHGHMDLFSRTFSPNELLPALCSRWKGDIIASSNKRNTFVPSPCLTWDHEPGDICQYRGLELLDGPIIYDGRYYTQLSSGVSSDVRATSAYMRTPAGPLSPTAEGVHSDLSMSIMEKTDRLLLYPTVTVHGQKSDICLADCLTRLLALNKTAPCEHDRRTPLKLEYSRAAVATSVRCPDPKDLEGKIAVAQTAGSPTAQILSLFKGTWDSARGMEVHPSLLCYHSCLNCAFETARERNIGKIIVA